MQRQHPSYTDRLVRPFRASTTSPIEEPIKSQVEVNAGRIGLALHELSVDREARANFDHRARRITLIEQDGPRPRRDDRDILIEWPASQVG